VDRILFDQNLARTKNKKLNVRFIEKNTLCGLPTNSEGCELFWHPSGVLILFVWSSGGLRFAPTTGYYLPALQAEDPDLRALQAEDPDLRALQADDPDLRVLQAEDGAAAPKWGWLDWRSRTAHGSDVLL
jgi:hypothetical protein